MQNPNQFGKLRTKDEPQQSRQADNVGAVLTPIATALNATPIMGAPPPPWVPLELSTLGLTVFGPASGGFSPSGPGTTANLTPTNQPMYHVDALGYVWTRGWVRNPTGGALFGTLATFPIGVRPNIAVQFPATYSVAGTPASVAIATDGRLIVPSIAAGQNLSWYFAFLAEQ